MPKECTKKRGAGAKLLFFSVFPIKPIFFDVPELYLLVPKQRHHVAKQETFNRSLLKADLVKT